MPAVSAINSGSKTRTELASPITDIIVRMDTMSIMDIFCNASSVSSQTVAVKLKLATLIMDIADP